MRTRRHVARPPTIRADTAVAPPREASLAQRRRHAGRAAAGHRLSSSTRASTSATSSARSASPSRASDDCRTVAGKTEQEGLRTGGRQRLRACSPPASPTPCAASAPKPQKAHLPKRTAAECRPLDDTRSESHRAVIRGRMTRVRGARLQGHAPHRPTESPCSPFSGSALVTVRLASSVRPSAALHRGVEVQVVPSGRARRDLVGDLDGLVARALEGRERPGELHACPAAWSRCVVGPGMRRLVRGGGRALERDDDVLGVAARSRW